MFIPAIGGESLKDVEKTVNAFLKLSIKIHALNPDFLVLISPDAPLLHNRFSLATGDFLARVFSSNTALEEIVEVTMPVASGEISEITSLAMEQKVQLDPYTQEHNVTAIDNGSLALLYYLSKVKCFPQTLLFGVSDMGVAKHQAFGKALSVWAEKKKSKKIAVVSFGEIGLLNEEHSSLFREGLEQKNLSEYVKKASLEDAVNSGSNLFMPLVVLDSLMKNSWEHSGLHLLGEDTYDHKGFFAGYFEQTN